MRVKKVRCNIKMPPPMYQEVQSLLELHRKHHPEKLCTLTDLLLKYIDIGIREEKRKEEYHKERKKRRNRQNNNTANEEKDKQLTDLIMGEG